ncbi:MAG: Hsp20/alpha crystallin family protein [Bryobacteraceae bacterium]|nr:Hsp20/alpha crystallin family protein [Bryobacteraceae bacterium]
MTLMKYAPATEMDEFTGRLFADTMSRLFADTNRPWAPAVDILETENEIVLHADLPGVAQSDIDIRVENGNLTLKGERKFNKVENGKGYHRVERGYGSFARVFTLPDTVEADKVKAGYTNGVLTVTLPKKEVAKPRTVKVEVGN